MNVCNNKYPSPSGLWRCSNLIGAEVKVKSFPGYNLVFNSSPNIGKKGIYKIKEIYVKVSTDGKGITVVELEEFPSKVFTWRDLEIVKINCTTIKDAICGRFNVNEALVGAGVEKDPSYGLEDSDLGNGIAVIGDDGTIVSGRYVRFVGADIEDPEGDPDNITDINVNLSGDVL